MGTEFGSFRKLKSGRYQARYTGLDGNRYSAPRTFPDKLEALAWLANVRKEIDLGVWEPPAVKKVVQHMPTVGEIVQHWLQLTQPQVRDSTFKAYQEIVTARVLGHQGLCEIPVDKLTPAMVAGWWQDTVTNFPDSGYRNSRAYHKLKAAVALAVEYGYLPANPVNIRAAKKRPKSKVKELPTTSELKAILEHVPQRYKFITIMCLFHGLRIGEALAIKGRNIAIHGDTASVTVEGNLVRVPDDNGGVKMSYHQPKTAAGNRIVPVLAEFVPDVRRHVDEFVTGRDEYVTMTARGSVVFDTSFRSIFNRAKSKAGITKEITPHYGRVYLITRLAEAGATPKEIGRILGQEDVSTIVNVYMRAREPRVTELMSRIQLGDD